ncbi:hypothetical protein V6N12_010398 [Hibiscus sabdariffa]|uniref:Uncharacterized protein n=1 Tax=Hibiscus sabdariffa TaxID=183260 RepID=A0ABR2EJY9_9ROSI
MEGMDNLMGHQDIIRDGPPLHKGSLSIRDTGGKDRFHTVDKDFGNRLIDDGAKADGPELPHGSGPVNLRNKHDNSFVDRGHISLATQKGKA